jgi:hypothetical protein
LAGEDILVLFWLSLATVTYNELRFGGARILTTSTALSSTLATTTTTTFHTYHGGRCSVWCRDTDGEEAWILAEVIKRARKS